MQRFQRPLLWLFPSKAEGDSSYIFSECVKLMLSLIQTKCRSVKPLTIRIDFYEIIDITKF